MELRLVVFGEHPVETFLDMFEREDESIGG